MRSAFTAVVLAGTLAVSSIGLAASPAVQATSSKKATSSESKTAPAAKKVATKAAATHSTTGTVKSVTSTMLVITESGKKKGDMTFVVEPSTQQEGTVGVGAMVSVRYRQDGKSNIATAVTARPAAKPKPKS